VVSTEPRPAHILSVIVAAQFAGTSLWFAVNAILPELQADWGLQVGSVAASTSSVQLGFIAGTLLFALSNMADRVPARALFLGCSLVGAACNIAIATVVQSVEILLVLRFATGVVLAGIYPVGMKIAASWFRGGLGGALGWLVGALVVGTAFPHLLRAGGLALPWQGVLWTTAALAAAGGLLLFWTVPDGPELPRKSPFDRHALPKIFGEHDFRAAAFGYFGHMWELYAWWAFVPLLLERAAARSGAEGFDIALWSFVAIAAGAVGCVVGGLVTRRVGSARVASVQIRASALCCLLAPGLMWLPLPAVLALVLFWGVVVVGDSPQFSTLTARTAPRHLVGTALTTVTCIGFGLTVPSLFLTRVLADAVGVELAMCALAPGPLLGWWALRRLTASDPTRPSP